MPNGSSSYLDWLAFKALLTLSKRNWVLIWEQESLEFGGLWGNGEAKY